MLRTACAAYSSGGYFRNFVSRCVASATMAEAASGKESFLSKKKSVPFSFSSGISP